MVAPETSPKKLKKLIDARGYKGRTAQSRKEDLSEAVFWAGLKLNPLWTDQGKA